MLWSTMRCPAGVAAIAAFFVFGTAMSGLTLFLLMFPGSRLDVLWRLNPRAHDSFISMGYGAAALMLLVSAACAMAAVGLWRCTRFGYRAAIVILSMNTVGDLANTLLLRDRRTLIGVPIAAAMMVYLYSRKRVFHSSTEV